MERERLTKLLEDPSRITRQDLADLVVMAERYPWFSGAQLLRAAGERLGGEVLSDETLRTAGAHLPSRSVLFDLTNNTAPQPTAPMRVVRTVEAPVADPTTPAVEPVAVTPPIPPGSVAPIHTPEPLPDPIIEPEPIVKAAPAESATDESAEELDRLILESAAASAYSLTALEPLDPPAAIVEPPAVPVVPEPRVEVIPQVDPKARLRFTDWLEVANVTPTATPSSALAPPDAKVGKPTPEVTDTTALIDRFIRSETPEPNRKTAFFTPQQAGKRSLDDSAGLVTETLARIYAKQGNTAKAIDAYRRLALKYPEKSAYFAALSKALEEQQNP
ncbi:MAG: hypothetical protein IPP83_06255 [Flavobacteriales bacterium]|nr:hypothetical protein [Flavobacteriales bacterium]